MMTEKITKKYYFVYNTIKLLTGIIINSIEGNNIQTNNMIFQADTFGEINNKLLELEFEVPIEFQEYITNFETYWQRKDYNIRFHIRLIDAFGEGILSAKTQEMQIKGNPNYRVNRNHKKDIYNGDWIDLYLKKIDPNDLELINTYLVAIADSKLEHLDEL